MPPQMVGVTKEMLRAKLEEALTRFDGEELPIDPSAAAAGANPLMPTEAERTAAANGKPVEFATSGPIPGAAVAEPEQDDFEELDEYASDWAARAKFSTPAAPAPTPAPTATAPTVLHEAAAIIDGDRMDTYGNPAESFERIAGLWSAYLGHPVYARDVANLMVLLKVSRSKRAFHRDDYTDICGYAALAERISE
ncbi:MAG: hypothetical protein JWN03_7424 [Nocardia sp.]|uniref:DUF6378 domain-containing protein n=1 Tax=Nocardia sp. TaxID=1821 RepID=UPI00262095D5|nr:DUF6378 domain-containing protein [Nocardia sp.]MCU1647149.1 hypothetical protein [Nocardia sp.]